MSNIEVIKKTIVQMREQFAKVLPEHVTPDKFVRTVNTALMKSPNLAGLDRKSLLQSCMQCAADGLLPDGKEAALVPFGKQVQYLPMVAGILKQLHNSGELKSLASAVVYENDVFEYYTDQDGEKFMHKPMITGDRGKQIGVFAQAVTKSDGRYFEFMNVSQINDIKSCVRGKSGPWFGPFEDEMWRKTVIRKLSKRLPMSTDNERLVKRDDTMIDLNLAQPREVTHIIEEGPTMLKEAIKVQAVQEVEEPKEEI
jgi:recombination protein RecT